MGLSEAEQRIWEASMENFNDSRHFLPVSAPLKDPADLLGTIFDAQIMGKVSKECVKRACRLLGIILEQPNPKAVIADFSYIEIEGSDSLLLDLGDKTEDTD